MNEERLSKLNHMFGKENEKLSIFLNNADAYAILQLKHADETAYEMFSSLNELNRMGLKPNVEHYKVVYAGALSVLADLNGIPALLEQLYQRFNINHPYDYKSRSVSVSDVILLNHNGEISCHFVNVIGFQELFDFI